MKNSNNTQGFLKINNDLLKSQKLSSTEKIFISYILGWQANDMECFESTNSIAESIGLSVHTFKKVITKFNKEFGSFYIVEYPTGYSHKLSIDIDALYKFLELAGPIKEKKSAPTAKEVAMAEIEEEEYVEVVTDEIQPTIEDYQEPIETTGEFERILAADKAKVDENNKWFNELQEDINQSENAEQTIVGGSKQFKKATIKNMVNGKLVEATPRELQNINTQVYKWYTELAKKWVLPTKKEIETKAIDIFNKLKNESSTKIEHVEVKKNEILIDENAEEIIKYMDENIKFNQSGDTTFVKTVIRRGNIKTIEELEDKIKNMSFRRITLEVSN